MDNLNFLEEKFLSCILENSKLEERFIPDDMVGGEDTIISDFNIIIQTGSIENLKIADQILQAIGLKDVIIKEVIEQELHFYDDYPKGEFLGRGVYATIQFNV